jgi:DNA-binding CsgD family transcriptional regulator
MPQSRPAPSPDSADIFAVISAFQACRTPQEAGAVLVAALLPFGLRHYAIGGMPTPADPNPTRFMFHNWPEAWGRMYFERDYASVDPVPRAAMTCAMPLTVGELRAGKAGFLPGPEADEYFANAEQLAGNKGLIVPIAGPHGYHGIVVLIGEREDFPPEDRARLHLLGIYAHDRMLDLFGREEGAAPRLLSDREVAVLRLARAGTGDEAIAQHLGIAVRTVRFHFENARKKLGVKTRAEALVTAVGLHLLGA